MIPRRDLIAMLAGGAVAWPVAALAQHSEMPVVGYLSAFTRDHASLLPFHQGLGEAGFEEGKNVEIEYRWAEGDYGRLPALAVELARMHVTAIAAVDGTAGALAAQSATKTIPIIFSIGTDPVALGLVASLNRPGGNLTGITNLSVTIVAKRFELLSEMLPNSAAITLLVNPKSANADENVRNAETAVRTLGRQLHVVNAAGEAEFESAFATIATQRPTGLVGTADSLFGGRSDRLAALAAKYQVPAIFPSRGFASSGGLMEYANDPQEAPRLVGNYVGKILQGAKSSELPVVQPTTFRFVVNLKTAKSLGLTVPTATLVRADEVIE